MKLNKFVSLNEVALVNADKKSFGKDETIRALRECKMVEYDAVNMYTQVAQATKIPFVKKVILDIANDERKHAGEFADLLARLGEKDDEFDAEGRTESKRNM